MRLILIRILDRIFSFLFFTIFFFLLTKYHLDPAAATAALKAMIGLPAQASGIASPSPPHPSVIPAPFASKPAEKAEEKQEEKVAAAPAQTPVLAVNAGMYFQ